MIPPQTIDSEIAELMTTLGPKYNAGDLPGALFDIRKQMSAVPVPACPDNVERIQTHVPGGSDTPDVPIRVHRAKGTNALMPCMYAIHGGGYVFGTSELEIPRLDYWSSQSGCIGVAIDYRLAPETPYPGPLEDCYTGLKWTYDHADEYGIDRNRIGICGVSAGGGLAAALALLARDRGELPPLIFNLLYYPMLDDRSTNLSSTWDAPIWPPVANDFGWRSYLGDLFGAPEVPAYAAPARASDLSDQPPTYIVVGTLDLFFDEDVAYAQRLTHCGVATDLHVYPGAPHGFTGWGVSSAVGQRAQKDIDGWLLSKF